MCIRDRFKGIYEIAMTSQRLLFMMGLAATLLGLFGSAFELSLIHISEPTRPY